MKYSKLLLVAAGVCFVLATFGISVSSQVSLVPLGLLFVVGSAMLDE